MGLRLLGYEGPGSWGPAGIDAQHRLNRWCKSEVVNIYTWKGTFLSAVFFSPKPMSALWPELLAAWDERQLLNTGTATVLKIGPDNLTYEAVMEAELLYEGLIWSGGAGEISPKLQQWFAPQLYLPRPVQEDLAEVLVECMTNEDGSSSVYVSVPYEEAIETKPLAARVRSLFSFADVSAEFFVPRLFPVGVMGADVRVNSGHHLMEVGGKFSNWAFYGSDLLPRLRAAKASFTGREWRVLEGPEGADGAEGQGLFVRWQDWQASAQAPPEWQDAVRAAMEALMARPGA